uniref:Peptidase A1 domain-containing protein n=1 Tax=Cannabis sativa TaxID=3483 RepID=A0A803RCL3_CANSA
MMKGFLISTLAVVLLLLLSTAQASSNNNNCWKKKEQGSTLEVFHVYSTCSPFRPPEATSWEESVLQMQTKDQARVLYLSSLVARKSVVPIASGRQVVQSPTYIVRAQIGTPPQTMLLAMDTSNDAAWIPCDGCVGCSSTVFTPLKSTSYKPLPCSAPQCNQVHFFTYCLSHFLFFYFVFCVFLIIINK